MRKVALAAALGLGFALAGIAQGNAQTVVDIPTAKQLAVGLIERGQPAAARAILLPIAERNPDDAVTLIHLSRAERTLGLARASISNGKRAFRAASNKREKFQAARVTAQALSSNGQRTAAQVWLRRAGAFAPNAQAKEVVRREYRYVHRRNPLSFSFDLSVLPSDNINDAPLTNRVVLGPFVGISPTAFPISGVETNFEASATLRLPATRKAGHEITVSYFGRRVQLGSEAARINPDLTEGDFRFDRLQLGWAARFRPGESPGVFDVGLQIFTDESAGEHFQNGQSIRFGHTWRLSENQTFRFGTDIDLLDRTDRPVRSSETVKLEADWSIVINNRDRLHLQLGVADTKSESASVAHDAQSLRVTYAFGKPFLSTYFAFSTEYRRAMFDRRTSFLLDTREDDRIKLSVSATFPKLDLYGFAPVLELTHERNRSNIASFDSRSTQFGITLRSTY